MKNILLESDSFHTDKFSSWLLSTKFYNTYNLFILTRPERKEKFTKELSEIPNLTFMSYRDIFQYQATDELSLEEYHNFVEFFFNHNHTARFLDREGYFPHYGIGVQSAFAYYADVAYNMLSFLKDHAIHAFYFRNTPHEFVEHMVSKGAEFLNIPLYTSEQMVFSWMFTLQKGIGKHRTWMFKDIACLEEKELAYQVTQYVQKLNGKYEDAMPLYEKNRKGKGIFKHYNPFENPIHLLKRPQKLWCMTRNFLFYKKNSKVIDYKNTKYILFFLHYQPERSTLPEGYGFEDQFLAIKILSKMLPNNIKIVVKEHPSMFIRGSELKVRSIYNYKSILKLPNVEFCKLHMDNFQLMDHALAISSITGTVALEGYVRKKPVILFGRCVLQVEGVHGFSTMENLQSFVNEVVQGNIKIDNVVENLINLCKNGTFSGLDDELPVVDYVNYRKYRTNAHLQSLTLLLNTELS